MARRKEDNNLRKFKEGFRILFFLAFLMWVLYSLAYNLYYIFKIKVDPLVLAWIVVVMVNLKHLFAFMIILLSRYVKTIGFNKFSRGLDKYAEYYLE